MSVSVCAAETSGVLCFALLSADIVIATLATYTPFRSLPPSLPLPSSPTLVLHLSSADPYQRAACLKPTYHRRLPTKGARELPASPLFPQHPAIAPLTLVKRVFLL